MRTDRAFWPSWAEFLTNKGVKDLAIWFLEGAAPVRILTAQILYAGIPFMRSSLQTQRWNALADLLDDSQEAQSFISYLKEV